jgi:FkbM family methyltransferase
MKQKDKDWLEFITSEVSQSYRLPFDCRGGVVIDCGSNVGAFPLVFNCRFDKYVCYEANPKNIKLMKEALDFYNLNAPPSYWKIPKYDLRDFYSVENKACYKTGGMTVPIYDHTDKRSGDCSIYLSRSHIEKDKIADVPTISVEDVRKKYFCESCKTPIRLLKCDIEGAEHDFLLNQDISIFKFVCMEIHGEEAKFHKMVSFLAETHDIIATQDKVVTARLKT